jgi:hypothetical protein
MVQLPIVDVKLTTAPIEMQNNRPPTSITDAEAAGVLRTIPTGTRVQIIETNISDIFWGRSSITGTTIKIIDGPLTGTVAHIDIKDLTKLTSERP